MKRLVVLAFTLVFGHAVLANEQPKPKVGLGLGIPYGLLGVNVEFPTTNAFSISTGAGIGFAKPVIAVGAHLTAPESVGALRPRMSFYYSNAVAALEVCEFSFYSDDGCEIEQFPGTAFGFGFVANHFHFELLFANSPAFEDRKNELEEDGASELENENNIALTLAYRF